MRPPHTLLNESLRLQFPFVFCRAQSLQLLPPAHPCFLAFAFWLLWALDSTAFTPFPLDFLTSAVFAFFRPLQFWILTTQPLFLLFPFLPVFASQWLFQCSSSAFASWVFPVLSDLVSHVLFPGSSYSAVCLFPFALP